MPIQINGHCGVGTVKEVSLPILGKAMFGGNVMELKLSSSPSTNQHKPTTHPPEPLLIPLDTTTYSEKQWHEAIRENVTEPKSKLVFKRNQRIQLRWVCERWMTNERRTWMVMTDCVLDGWLHWLVVPQCSCVSASYAKLSIGSVHISVFPFHTISNQVSIALIPLSMECLAQTAMEEQLFTALQSTDAFWGHVRWTNEDGWFSSMWYLRVIFLPWEWNCIRDSDTSFSQRDLTHCCCISSFQTLQEGRPEQRNANDVSFNNVKFQLFTWC